MISGPSGVGKDTLMEIIEKRNPEKIHIAITATTRKPRSNEINGINHFFVNKDKFNQMINNDELIEWAKVYENLYGVPKSEITNNLEKNNKVLIRVDVQGAERIRQIYEDSLQIFILPPNINILTKRQVRQQRLSRHSADA